MSNKYNGAELILNLTKTKTKLNKNISSAPLHLFDTV